MHQNIDAKKPLRYLAENGINLGFWNFPSLVKKKRKYFKIFRKKKKMNTNSWPFTMTHIIPPFAYWG